MEVEHDDIAPMEVEEETPQRPRKKLTPEHLEKMKAGRLRYLAAKKKAKVKIHESPMIIDDESSDSEPDVVNPPRKAPKKKQKQKKTRVVNNYYYNQQEESSEIETDEEVENNYYGQGLSRQNSMAISPPTNPDYIFR
jgi:hypothetical protein